MRARSGQIRSMETLVARCLTDPAFLDSAAEAPERIRSVMGNELRSYVTKFDFRKLQQFSGFIGKVQHNYLWEHFPQTRRLLWEMGIEHEVFAAYRSIQLGESLRSADRTTRIRRVCQFLISFAATSSLDLLLCVVTHERSLWELRSNESRINEWHRRDPLMPSTWQGFQKLVPRLSPHVRFSTFECDPLDALELAGRGEVCIPSEIRKPAALLYLLDSARYIRTFRLDPISAQVYLHVSGRRSVRSVIARARSAGLDWIRPSALRPVFADGASAGFLVWEGDQCE